MTPPATARAEPREAARLIRLPEPRQAETEKTLWRNGRFETDAWTYTAEDEAVGEGPAILPLGRFLAERDALASRDAPIGVIVAPGETLESLTPHLAGVALVVLPFPKFSDGRSSSTARLLRERHGFSGEIRATGDVLIDQMPLMRRCGFDAFEVASEVTRRQLKAGKWMDIPYYLQPVGSLSDEIPAGRRPWARRPAPLLQAAE